jgi:UDP-N-acetylmuramate--alanine ligase
MKGHYHFIGIGGIGMGALAVLLLRQGHRVTGSDIRENPIVLNLRKEGAAVHIGHHPGNVGTADFVVFSSAIKKDNPELAEAKRLAIPILQRAQLLASLMQGHAGITVAGAHGKTTTTSMISSLLTEAGLHPTTAVGGLINGASSNARLGAGEYFVAEVDESDGSFLYFAPRYSVITNIDFEHVDYFHNWDNILEAYRRFIRQTERAGVIIACGDDPRLSSLVKECLHVVHTYGLAPHNKTMAENCRFDQLSSSFDCVMDGKHWGKVELIVPGRHNIVNAMACITLGVHLSIPPEMIRRSLAAYRGVQRRFQVKETVDDIWVVDDYAHHPTEIRATLAAARLMNRKRVVAVFQPHRYSRVQCLMEEMAGSLTNSDYVIVTDIYAASEPPIEGVTAGRLKEHIQRLTANPVVYLEKEDITGYLLNIVRPGDLVLMLGAGDITYIADALGRLLREARGPRTETDAMSPEKTQNIIL